MATISLEGVTFYSHHGCFKEEQKIGTKFQVDCYIEANTSESEFSDNLNDTVNYQEVFLVIKDEMSVKSKLLEHVCRRIINRLFLEFPAIQSVKFKLAKLNPPLGGSVDRVCLTLYEDRS